MRKSGPDTHPKSARANSPNGISAMTEKRHRRYGNTVDEWIAGWVAEPARDATGLWHIVTAGRDGFGLSGPELIDFVRRSLLALFAAGAKPVIGDVTKVYHWVRLKQYGDTPEEMADAIIGEWQKSGCDPDHGGVWFATPNVYEEKRGEGAANSGSRNA
jgi:hypothetical protein